MDIREDIPVLVGELTIKTGLKGFEEVVPGHPVFEVRDRYVLFLRSETKLVENIYNQTLGMHETVKFFYDIMVPYYKDTLKPHIKFNNEKI